MGNKKRCNNTFFFDFLCANMIYVDADLIRLERGRLQFIAINEI